MSKKVHPDLEAIRGKLRTAAKKSGLTQEQIGLAMGFSKSGARQAVSRLLSPETNYDPRLTTLLQFAKAVHRPLKDILG